MFRESNRCRLPYKYPLDADTRTDLPGVPPRFNPVTRSSAMTRSVWLKADDEVGDWETRKRRITAGLEAGVDWVLVDEEDVDRVSELGEMNVAAFTNGDVHVMEAEAEDSEADATIVGKDGEGDGTVDLPSDVPALRTSRRCGRTGPRLTTATSGSSTGLRGLAEAVADEADFTIVIGENWQIIPLENLIARVGEETDLIAGVRTAEDARTAYETLELGADGVLLDTDEDDELRVSVEVRDELVRSRST